MARVFDCSAVRSSVDTIEPSQDTIEPSQEVTSGESGNKSDDVRAGIGDRQAANLCSDAIDEVAVGLVARPWGDKSTNRAKSSADVDFEGHPLWLDSDKGIVDTIQRIAETRGVPMAQVAMAWVLKNPVVDAPIVGATKEQHLSDAVASLDLQLTDDEVIALEEPYVLRQATWF
jgi:hypothetical protein